jgi:putative hemagglutination activity domain protein
MKIDTLYQPKLSASGKVTVAVCFAFLGNAAVAANIEAIGQTSVQQQHNVDIVNIAAPTAQGLSHNQYNKYNVSQHGAVLNNALSAGKSQLAGNLSANKNFQGQAASVILNEVVSKNPSLILGQQEIFGIAADYVLANPNGITHNGGSILNANRASLVVGTPTVSDGALKSFNISDNGKQLQVNGNLSGNRVVDLLAPQVVVGKSANVNAADAINVSSGKSNFDYKTAQIEALDAASNAPVLDGHIFGSMRAGTIRIHATDKRAKQNIQNAAITGTRYLNIDSKGNLSIQSANLTGAQMELFARDTDIKGTVTSHSANKSSSGKEAQNVQHFRSDRNKTETFTASNINASESLTLNNSGSLNLSAANINAGALTASATGNINSNAVKTTNRTESDHTQSKGLWYNNNLSSSADESLHQTKINAGSVNIATTGKVQLDATELNSAADARIAAQQGIVLSSNSETDSSSTYVSFKNETAALKTGIATKSSKNSTAHQTKISAAGDIGLISEGDLSTYGASIAANGNVVTDVNNINLGTQTTINTNSLDDQKKYWGGLFGGESQVQNNRTENLHGSSITANSNVVLGAKNGVNVYGSTVEGQAGTFVSSKAGNVDIKNATSTDTSAQSARKGTIFNITTSKTSSNSSIEKVTGSTLVSNADLTVVSNKDINVIGSALFAAQKLQLSSAGDLTIDAAKAVENKQVNEYSIKGYSGTETNKENGSVTAKAGIKFTDTHTDTHSVGLNGSILTGKNTQLSSNSNVTVSGSQVNGEESVNISAANDVNVVASKGSNTVTESGRVTDLGVSATAYEKNNVAGVGVSVGITSTKTDATTVTNTSHVSNINTGGNATITANGNINQEGTVINATGNVVEAAKNVTHAAAHSGAKSDVKQNGGGLVVSAGISTNKGIGGEITAQGQGNSSTHNESTATVTTINAGNAIVLANDKVSDEGTKYDVTGAINIDAGSYHNTAAHNTSNSSSKQGGASLTVGAYTKDGSNVDVNANLNVNYADENKKESTAVKGDMNATNVVINAKDSAEIASNITANNNVNITAGNGVTFTESANTASNQGTAVNVGIGAGATINVETGVAVPHVNGSVGVNKTDNASSTAAGANVAAGNEIKINANNGDVNLHGTNLVSNNSVEVEGNKVNTSGAISSVNEKNLTVNVNGSYASGKPNGGINAKGKNEANVTNTANTIQSDNVVITTGSPTGLSVNNTTINGNNVAYYYDDSKAPAANRYTYRPRQPSYAKRRLRY